MQSIKKIKNISNFHFASDKFVFCGTKLTITDTCLSELKLFDLFVGFSVIFEENLLLQEESGQEVLFLNLLSEDLEIKILGTEKFYLFKNTIIDDFIFINNTNNSISVLDKTLSKKKEYNIGRYLKILPNAKILNQSFNELLLLDISENNSPQIQWKLNFQTILNSQEAKLFGDLIEDKGNLFFFLSDQNGKYGIYCVEIATGKILNQTNEIGGFLKLSSGLLYLNTDYILTTIHSDTFEIKQIDLRSVLEPKGLNLGIMMQINLMVGELYYFVCQNGRSGAATMGIINLEDKNLVWTIEIPIESGSYWVKEIQVHGNRLFVLTQGGTLHIFERDLS